MSKWSFIIIVNLVPHSFPSLTHTHTPRVLAWMLTIHSSSFGKTKATLSTSTPLPMVHGIHMLLCSWEVGHMSELFGWVGWVGLALCCGCTCLEQLDLNLSTPQNCGYSGISVEFSRSSCVHENWFSLSLQWGGDSPFLQVVIVAVIRSLEHHQFLSLHHIQHTCTMTACALKFLIFLVT